MRSIWHIAVNDLRLMLTERAAFLIRLFMPIAFILVIGIANGAFQSEPTPRVLAIVDGDNTRMSSILADRIRSNASGYTICGDSDSSTTSETGSDSPCSDSDNLDALFDADKIDVAVIIPEGFTRLVESGNEVSLSLVQAVGNPQEESRLVSLIDAAASWLEIAFRSGDGAESVASESQRAAARESAIEESIAILDTDRIEIDVAQITLPNRYQLEGFQQSVPGMGSMFVMLSVLAGASVMIDERKRWTLQRTMIAPISKASYLSGKVLGRFFVGILQFAIAIGTGLILGQIFDIDFGSSPGKMAATMVAFVFCVSALALFIATIVRREQQAGGITTLLATTLAPIGGAWWSLELEFIPDIMRSIAVISPFYWVMRGFRSAIFDLAWSTVLPPIGVLMLFTAVFVVAGALRFDANR